MANDAQKIARLLQTLFRASRGKMSVGWMIALGVVVGGYLVFEPALEARLGVDLPGVHSPEEVDQNDTGQVVFKSDDQNAAQQTGQQTTKQTSTDAKALSKVLKEIGRDKFVSPAGILYTRGSRHGTRLKHLMAHAKDQPNRPGQHGVFNDSDAATVLLLIDEAYEQAISGQSTQKKTEGNRTIYTVHLGRTIGYIGGQSGARRRHPQARHVRLVLEGKKLITGFPVIP